jgi:RNA polymerase sigma factor (sigma-70 family)
MTELTDQEWIRRLKQDDPQAIQALWELLFTYAVNQARRYRQDEDLGRDAAVEAYSRVRKRGVHQFRFKCSFRGYCSRILANEMLRQMNKPSPSEIELDEELVGTQESPPRIDLKKVRALLRLCLKRLNHREREVCDLRYKELQAPETIAARLGISRNYVNVIAYRARAKLRQCLEERGYYSSADVLYSL